MMVREASLPLSHSSQTDRQLYSQSEFETNFNEHEKSNMHNSTPKRSFTAEEDELLFRMVRQYIDQGMNAEDHSIYEQITSVLPEHTSIDLYQRYLRILGLGMMQSSPFKTSTNQGTLFGVLNVDGDSQRQFALSNNIPDLNCKPDELLKELLSILPTDTHCEDSELGQNETCSLRPARANNEIEVENTTSTEQLPFIDTEACNRAQDRLFTEEDFYQLRQFRLVHDAFEKCKNINGYEGLVSLVDLLTKALPVTKSVCYYLVYQCAGDITLMHKMISDLIPLLGKDVSECRDVSWAVKAAQETFHKRPWNRKLDNSLTSLDSEQMPSLRESVIFGDDSLYLYKRRKWISINKAPMS